jgi:serine/threonine protein kinase
MAEEVKCSRCGHATPVKGGYCIYCGAPLKGISSKQEVISPYFDNPAVAEEDKLPSSLIEGIFTPYEEEDLGFPVLGEPDRFTPFKRGEVVNERYDILEIIGRGGMGIVYKVFDRILKEFIALKVLLPSLMQSRDAVERFENEAKISLQLSHPNIVRVRDLGEAGDIKFISMELLDGVNLREWLNAKKKREDIEVYETIKIIRQVCEGLNYAHKYTVHRDIKPENIMVLEGLKVKITDFGIAKLLTPVQFASTLMTLGTAYYMAPEQSLSSADVDHRADIFSIGVIFYELLVGKLPIGRFRLPSEIKPELGSRIDGIITKALEPEPLERYSNIYEMYRDMLLFEEEMQGIIAKRRRELAKKKGKEEVPLHLEPDFFVHFDLGVKYQQQGRYDLAIEQYKKALEIEYNYAKTHNNLGSVYFLTKKYDQSIQEYQEAIDIKPDYAEAYYNLGLVYETLDKFESAEKNYLMAARFKPDHPQVHKSLGDIYKRLNKYEDAIKEYQRALKVTPDSSALHNRLGNAYFLIKQYEKAVGEYEKALSLKPDYELAQKNLEKVKKLAGKDG